MNAINCYSPIQKSLFTYNMELTGNNGSNEHLEIFYSDDDEQPNNTGNIPTLATMDWQNATNASIGIQGNLTMEIETETDNVQVSERIQRDTDRIEIHITEGLRLTKEITEGAKDLVERYLDKAEKLRQTHEVIQRLENLNGELMQEIAMAGDRIDRLWLDQEIQDREMLDLSQQLSEYEEEIFNLTEERDRYRDEIGLLLRRLNWR